MLSALPKHTHIQSHAHILGNSQAQSALSLFSNFCFVRQITKISKKGIFNWKSLTAHNISTSLPFSVSLLLCVCGMCAEKKTKTLIDLSVSGWQSKSNAVKSSVQFAMHKESRNVECLNCNC